VIADRAKLRRPRVYYGVQLWVHDRALRVPCASTGAPDHCRFRGQYVGPAVNQPAPGVWLVLCSQNLTRRFLRQTLKRVLEILREQQTPRSGLGASSPNCPVFHASQKGADIERHPDESSVRDFGRRPRLQGPRAPKGRAAGGALEVPAQHIETQAVLRCTSAIDRSTNSPARSVDSDLRQETYVRGEDLQRLPSAAGDFGGSPSGTRRSASAHVALRWLKRMLLS
jgi:hypothetical protein